MTRRQRLKKPSIQKTRLIVGEGADEAAFLKYLKSLYHLPKSGWHIKIIPAQGGSPENIIDFTIRRKTIQDEIFIVLDTDKPWSKELIKKAKGYKIELIGLNPKCLDCFLLKLLDEEIPVRSQTCKNRFQTFLKKKKASDSESYKLLFSRSLLDDKRKNNKLLDQLIKLFS